MISHLIILQQSFLVQGLQLHFPELLSGLSSFASSSSSSILNFRSLSNLSSPVTLAEFISGIEGSGGIFPGAELEGIEGDGLMAGCGLGVRRDGNDIDVGLGTSGGEAGATSGGDSERGDTPGGNGSWPDTSTNK
eukprot:TRINITY_DN4768_c0_g1_i1.p1 TRINITY_DN4768_c0_g1~~TRINITY_DN4768_c0_g1_i1.p1  ORF type:complete len:135 (+),score=37.02 TRINITY_DN4768_c0_g1_i1:284-688(+)